MRLGLILVSLFAAGAAVGWLVAVSQAAVKEPEIVTVTDTAQLEELEAKVARLESYRDQLASTNRDITAQLVALLGDQAALEEAAFEWEAPVEGLEQSDDQVAEEALDQTEARERRRQQTEEWRSRISGQMREMFDRQFAGVEDPAALESLAALNEWREYQQSLRQELRGAETEEERNAIFAEMEEARSNSQQLVNEQQEALLRAFAEEHGISGDSELADFNDQLRKVLEDPFFRMERMLVGGGGPMGRGGSMDWGGMRFGGGPRGRRGPGGRSSQGPAN